VTITTGLGCAGRNFAKKSPVSDSRHMRHLHNALGGQRKSDNDRSEFDHIGRRDTTWVELVTMMCFRLKLALN
jgi:hypothetical protein